MKPKLKPTSLQPPLADRRAYLKNFWYAAALSKSLQPGKPLGVDILSQKLVLFRDADGKAKALDDTCPHRAAPLSAGWIDTDVEGRQKCVKCPYHGWAFDGDGCLVSVPAAETLGEWPKRRQIVGVHDVVEKGGFLWVWYGTTDLPIQARPPIPMVPELEDTAWKAVYGEIEFECNHSAVFENALDMAHIHYVHASSFGNQKKPQIRDMECVSDSLGVTATFKLHNKPASPFWNWSKIDEVHVTAKAFLPSTSAISFTLGNGLSFTTFVNTTPISPDKSINRFALVRHLDLDKIGIFNADIFDMWAERAMLKILNEDKDVVERLRPDLIDKEYSVRADLPQLHFRKLRQSWIDLGFVTREVTSSASQEE